MSFLNPVNEPVLRFSSTDANAPQINYNARVAGDVKAVLKACLATGYGAKASAGWSIVNEVGHVAEFVSPSAAMSDYRLGVDDTSTSSTTWYNQYQDVRANFNDNQPTKGFSYADKSSVKNGWKLLVTERGIVFIELVQHTSVNKLSGRITYWGALKSGLPAISNKNICFFSIGHNSPSNGAYPFFQRTNFVYARLAEFTSVVMSAATSAALSNTNGKYEVDISIVDLVSPIYLSNSDNSALIGSLPPMYSKIINKTSDLYGIEDTTIDNRHFVSVCAGFASTTTNAMIYSRTFLIPTDHWEY